MKAVYDLSKANAAIDEYAAAVRDTSQLPGKHGRTWLEFLLQRNGVIADVRGLAFGETFAIWLACLITTKRVREISRLEKENRHAYGNRTTEALVRRMHKPTRPMDRDSLIARLLREILEAGD